MLKRLDSRDLAALSDIADLLEPPGASVVVPQPSGPAQAKRRATSAWLAKDFSSAADHFGTYAGFHSESTPGRALGLRLRAAALLRAKRFEEAVHEAQAALASLGEPAADPATDKSFFESVLYNGASADALATWQLLGVANEALGQQAEAAHSIGRALLLASVAAADEATGGVTGGGSGASAAAALKRSGSNASFGSSLSLLGESGGAGGKGLSGLLHASSPALAATGLLTHFLNAAASSPSGMIPLQVYVTLPIAMRNQRRSSALLTGGAVQLASSGSRPSTAGSQRPGSAGGARPGSAAGVSSSLNSKFTIPAFRLVLRPRFIPWPLDLQVGELPGVEIEGGTRLSFFCAYKEMPAEPHAVLVAHHRDKHALVLMSIRIDGQIEVLSNSTEAAWDQVKSLLGHPPTPRTLHDFDVSASGWQATGLGVGTFGALVSQKWSEWEEGRGKAAAKRKDEEKKLARRQASFLEWLTSIGLEELYERLIREGVDLEKLPYIKEEDLIAMGVTQIAQRKQLMAAVETQAQYQQLHQQIDALEDENRDLRITINNQKAKLKETNEALNNANSTNESLTSELRTTQQTLDDLRSHVSDPDNGLEALLKQTEEKYHEADRMATAFASDAAELLNQLQSVRDSQAGHFKELAFKIDKETLGVKERVRSLKGTPKKAPSGGAPAMAPASAVDLPRGMSSSGSLMSLVDPSVMKPPIR